MIATKNGKLNGFYYYFFDTGSVRGKFYYINGQQNGEFITFHKNGNPRSIGQSLRYIPYDLEKFFNENGKLESTIIHIK